MILLMKKKSLVFTFDFRNFWKTKENYSNIMKYIGKQFNHGLTNYVKIRNKSCDNKKDNR